VVNKDVHILLFKIQCSKSFEIRGHNVIPLWLSSRVMSPNLFFLENLYSPDNGSIKKEDSLTKS